MSTGELPPAVVTARDDYRAALTAERAELDAFTARPFGTPGMVDAYDRVESACRKVVAALDRLRAACDDAGVVPTVRHEVERSVWEKGR